jgi:hypothetical protein
MPLSDRPCFAMMNATIRDIRSSRLDDTETMIMLVLCALAIILLSLPVLNAQKATPEAIASIAAAMVLATLAAAGPRGSWRPGRWARLLAGFVVFGMVATDTFRAVLSAFEWSDRFEAVARLKPAPPSWLQYYEPGQIKILARTMIPAFALLGLAILAYATPLLPRWRFPLILVSSLILGAWVIQAWPKPKIDVLLIQEDACRDLLGGRSPYATDHPRIPWKRGVDAPITRSLTGPFMRSFPYPPLSILAALPGYALGDVRWSILAATVGASALMVAIGRKSGMPAGHISELAAVGVLVGPSTLPMLMGSYIEPFLFCAVVGYVLAKVIKTPMGEGLALAAVLGMKQYGFLVAIPLVFSGKTSLRSLLWAGAILLAVNLPFLLWDPAAMKLGLIDELLQAPVRSVCLPAFLQARYQFKIPPEFGIVGFLASTAMLALVVVRSRGNLARSTAGAAAVVLTFFFLGRVGLLHYFNFCRNLLWLGILLGFVATVSKETKAWWGSLGPLEVPLRGRK